MTQELIVSKETQMCTPIVTGSELKNSRTDRSAEMLKRATSLRNDAIDATADAHRAELAQHLTPPETAEFAASMFTDTGESVTCLDLGAGTGILSVALAMRYEGKIHHVDCVELDSSLATLCRISLHDIPNRLYIQDALEFQTTDEYDRVIMNPPYKKMASNDPRHHSVAIKTPNLYSSFIVAGLSKLTQNGECVAIVPRSWMNGMYFTKFRQWIVDNFSIDAIHIYDSRSEVFRDTNVLQETMLVKFSRRPQIPQIRVTTSDAQHSEIHESLHSYKELISGDDCIIRIAPSGGAIDTRIGDLGFCPSTGKVVDFRARDNIFTSKTEAESRGAATSDLYPLIYVGNFRRGKLSHPADIKKGQWFHADTPRLRKQLFGRGSYVVVKRFSAKEERRRVVAFPVELTEPVAFENHSTIIHSGTPRQVVPLPSAQLAQGLALWLNSTQLDNWFRDVSGSTQVNARDIRAMPCPPIERLLQFGELWQVGMSQELIDSIVES